MLNQERLEKIYDFKLDHGSHESLEKGACVMEMVSYVAGEPWSDHPKCACPVLTNMAIRLNDRADTETRQKLKPLIPKLVGTRSDKVTEKLRADFLVHHSITVVLPLLTDALNLGDISMKLKSFKIGEWIEMRNYCREIRPKLRDAAATAATAATAADAYAAAAAAAADADAYAAAVAGVAADAYAAADDAAAAAAPLPEKAQFWKGVKEAIWNAAFHALEHACEIGKAES